MNARPRGREELTLCVTKKVSVAARIVSKGKVRGGEVVTEARPQRTVNPDKEFRFYYCAKGSRWKVLTR